MIDIALMMRKESSSVAAYTIWGGNIVEIDVLVDPDRLATSPNHRLNWTRFSCRLALVLLAPVRR